MRFQCSIIASALLASAAVASNSHSIEHGHKRALPVLDGAVGGLTSDLGLEQREIRPVELVSEVTSELGLAGKKRQPLVGPLAGVTKGLPIPLAGRDVEVKRALLLGSSTGGVLGSLPLVGAVSDAGGKNTLPVSFASRDHKASDDSDVALKRAPLAGPIGGVVGSLPFPVDKLTKREPLLSTLPLADNQQSTGSSHNLGLHLKRGAPHAADRKEFAKRRPLVLGLGKISAGQSSGAAAGTAGGLLKGRAPAPLAGVGPGGAKPSLGGVTSALGLNSKGNSDSLVPISLGTRKVADAAAQLEDK
ncbi:hypothetical protein OC842_004226 [Tilletia horrida]|uniref:Uncharacterized protein n=1 Tax=Tilletia horrida TaxID=155126 RepID=A0AAN6G9S1_9BASI|nr:hypothetical protein OC842_004226 [Tilletia horrida]